MDRSTISLRIIGKPVPKGRPRVTKSGITYTPKPTKEWQKSIQWQAKKLAPPKLWTGAIRADREYIMPRPRCHENTQYHTKYPDIDNLDKALFDALQGIFFVGDQQICMGIHTKRYTNPGEEPGIITTFTLLA